MVDVPGLGAVPRLWLTTFDDWWEGMEGEEELESLNYWEEKQKQILGDLAILGKENADKLRNFSWNIQTKAAEVFVPGIRAFEKSLASHIPPSGALSAALDEDWEKEGEPIRDHGKYNKHEDTLHWCSHVFGNAEAIKDTYQTIIQFIADQFDPVLDVASVRPFIPLATAPAYELLPDARQTVDTIYRLFTETLYTVWVSKRRTVPKTFALTHNITMQLLHNHAAFCADRRLNPETYRPAHIDASPKELVYGYFKDTPLLEFFTAQVPVRWQFDDRFDHTHIMGRPKSGKTTLMETMILTDILTPVQCSLVVMTPHADLIRKLKNLAPPYSNKMILIDPTDTEYPPAINPFAPKGRKTSVNQVIETFDYILASLNLEFSPKQRTLWKHTVRMLANMPQSPRKQNATVFDIRDFLVNPMSYLDVINTLTPPQRKFFDESVLPSEDERGKKEKKIFDGTREEIGYRLDDVLFDDAIATMLSSQETRFDFYNELNNGSIILIDTAKRALGDGSALFGGVMLSLIVQAMFARDEIEDEDARYPTFVYVDEAQNYFSGDISDALQEIRKFKCGLVLAHHDLAQAQKRSTELRRSLVAAPGVKLVAPSAADANEMASEMNTTPEAIRDLPQYHFAMYIKHVTPSPLTVKVKPIELPTMSYAQQQAFLWRNRDKVSAGPGSGDPNYDRRIAPRLNMGTSTPPATPAIPPPVDDGEF